MDSGFLELYSEFESPGFGFHRVKFSDSGGQFQDSEIQITLYGANSKQSFSYGGARNRYFTAVLH